MELEPTGVDPTPAGPMPDSYKPNPPDSQLFLAISQAAKNLIHPRGWRHGIMDFLEALGTTTGTNRVWLFEVVEQGPNHYVTNWTYEWADRPDTSIKDDPRYRERRFELDHPELRALYQSRLNGEVLIHQRAEVEDIHRREFEVQGIHSMLTIPIMVEGQWWGILGFDDCDAPRTYPDSYVAALEIAAVLITNGILRERLEWEVHHDHLTGLLNRRALIREIELALEREPTSGTLVIIDIDWFKTVNDRYGHQAGDEVLKAFSQLMLSQVPESAILARFGGEEFALWLPTNGLKARLMVEKLRAAILTNPVNWCGETIALTASFGISEMRSGGGGPMDTQALFEKVFSRADNALFQAKRQGRNLVVYEE